MKNKSFLSRACEGSKMVRERIGYGTGQPGKWKVLASVMLLLTMGIGQVWGLQNSLVSGRVLPDIPSLTLNLASQTDFTPDGNGWIVFGTKGVIDSKEWASHGSTDGSSGKTWAAPSGTEAPFVGGTSAACYTVQSGRSLKSGKYADDGKKTHAIRFTGAEKASFLMDYTNETRKGTVSLFSYNGETQSLVATTSTSSTSTEILFSSLSTSTTYIAYIYGTSDDSNSSFYEVALKAPAGVDETAPTFVSSNPANGATNVAVSGNIVLTFSENVTINDASKFTISPSTGVTLSTPTVSGAAVTIPYSGLANSTEYTLAVAADAVKDGSNNKNAALSDISFTTVAAVAPVEEIPTPCAVLIPATSGDAPAVGDVITMQTGSTGGTMTVSNLGSGNISYTTSGLGFNSKSGPTVKVVLNHLMQAGTIISLDLVAAGADTRGLTLKTKTGSTISAFTCWVKDVNGASNGAEDTFTYTVVASDGLEGTNEFQLARNNSVYLKELSVANCGDELLAVTFNMHGHGTAVNPQYIAEGGKVTQPATASISGWDFGGWYKESTYDNAWDFANDVVNETTELHAKWTTHVASTDATLSALSVAGYNIGFEASKLTYDVELPKGSVIGDLPAVSYTLNDAGATAVKTDATVLPGSTTVVVTAEDESTTKTYTINFTVSSMDKYVIFSGQTNALETVPDAPTGLNWKKNSDSNDKFKFIEYTSVAGYTNAILTGGNSSADRNIAVTIPANYEVVFEISQASNKNNETRHAYVGAANNTAYADALFSVESSSQTDGQKAKSNAMVGGKTYYIHCDKSINILEINIYMDRVSETPVISAEPADMSVCNYGTDELSVTAAVTEGTLSYQWYKEVEGDDDVVVGTNSATYAPAVAGKYYVVITNTQGEYKPSSVTSEKATVTDQTATAITAFAEAAGVVGANKTLSVTADGTGTITYQWQACNANGVVTNTTVLGTEASYAVTITEETQYYLVTVHSECGDDQTQILGVHTWEDVELADVTGSITWNWNKDENPSAWTGISEDITISATTILANANYGAVPNNANFRSDMLKAVVSTVQTKLRKNENNGCYQGNEIMFHTTVPGIVKVTYRGTSNSAKVTLTIGSETLDEYSGSFTTSKKVFVPAGDVTISSGSDAMRVQKIEFVADADYTRDVTAGSYGTICLPKAGVMVRAAIFEVAYLDNNDPYKKIFFDEVISGEMVAGRPYIFLPNEGVSTIGVFYTDDTEETAGNYRGLYGYIGATEDAYYSVPDGANNYIIYGNQYHYVQEGADARILSNRAYLKIGEDGVPTNSVAPAPGRRRVSMSGQGEQVATGTEEAQTDNIQCAKIVIDGQFFILRGEKMYDATGRLVK